MIAVSRQEVGTLLALYMGCHTLFTNLSFAPVRDAIPSGDATMLHQNAHPTQ